MKSTIDRAGRVVVPKAMRDQLGLTPGAEIDIALRHGTIEITPERERVELVTDAEGFRVLHAPPGTPALTDDDVRTMIDVSRQWPHAE